MAGAVRRPRAALVQLLVWSSLACGARAVVDAAAAHCVWRVTSRAGPAGGAAVDNALWRPVAGVQV